MTHVVCAGNTRLQGNAVSSGCWTIDSHTLLLKPPILPTQFVNHTLVYLLFTHSTFDSVLCMLNYLFSLSRFHSCPVITLLILFFRSFTYFFFFITHSFICVLVWSETHSHIHSSGCLHAYYYYIFCQSYLYSLSLIESSLHCFSGALVSLFGQLLCWQVWKECRALTSGMLGMWQLDSPNFLPASAVRLNSSLFNTNKVAH